MKRCLTWEWRGPQRSRERDHPDKRNVQRSEAARISVTNGWRVASAARSDSVSHFDHRHAANVSLLRHALTRVGRSR